MLYAKPWGLYAAGIGAGNLTGMNSALGHHPTPSNLYEEHRAYILGVLGRRCRWLDPSEREAILHDAFVVWLEKQQRCVLDTSSMEAEQVRAYLTQTALHKALDERKRAWRRTTVSLEESDTDSIDAGVRRSPVEDEVLARADVQRLLETIDGLPHRRKRVVQLRLLLDQSPTEIQQLLGLSARVYRRELERGTRAISDCARTPIGSAASCQQAP